MKTYSRPGRGLLAGLVIIMVAWIGPKTHGQSQPPANITPGVVPPAIAGGTNSPAAKTAKQAAAKKLAPGEKININTASAADLARLPGIGKSKAQAIIDYRTQNGNFKSPEEIEKVKGIKAGLFAKLKDYIELGSP